MNKHYCDYTEKDYEDKNRKGLSPHLWGSQFWKTLDFIAEGYAEKNASVTLKHALYNFLQSLQLLLPCSVCRRHLCENLKGEFKLDDKILDSKKDLKDYLNKLRLFIKNKYADKKSNNYYYYYGGLLVFCLIILYYIFKSFK